MTALLFRVSMSDMKAKSVRKYTSPLRESHTRDTRERILSAVGRVLTGSPDGALSFDQIAAESGIERRTVFRHFPNKEALLDGFWVWINARLAPDVVPRSLADLLKLPATTFAAFDRQEGVIRASLHTRSGREMRLRQLPRRQVEWKAALAEATAGLTTRDARRLGTVVHALYSAAAWETLKDYCGLSGEQAGETVSWAIQAMLDGLPRKQPKSRRTRT